ncbi:N/A [soil metagenome]
MKIAVVMPRGGLMDRDRANSMETVARIQTEHSRYAGEIQIVCDAGAEVPAPFDLITVPAGLAKGPRLQAVERVLRDLRPDIIEYHQQLESAAILAGRLRGPANVLYRHTQVKRPGNLIDRFRYRARLGRFDHLILVSEAACAEFSADYPGFQDRLSAICNPIDMGPWRADPQIKEPLILFSGRAMADKGLDVFCEAVALTLDRFPDWRAALMLGDWTQHEAWAAPHVDALFRFGDRVEVHRSAPLPLVRAMTRRAAIAVTPSRVTEAFGLSAVEALAAGAALISSGRGGLREASGPHAVYVDPPDAGALADAMASLIANPGDRIAMARAGQAYVAREHSPERRAAQLDDLRDRLILAKRSGAS